VHFLNHAPERRINMRSHFGTPRIDEFFRMLIHLDPAFGADHL